MKYDKQQPSQKTLSVLEISNFRGEVRFLKRHGWRLLPGLIWLILSACKTALVAVSASNAAQASPVPPKDVVRKIAVHGFVGYPKDSTRGLKGLEVVYRSLSADSVLESISDTTNANGEYHVTITERPLYQVALKKEGRTFELEEVTLLYSPTDSVGKVKNFWIDYDMFGDENYSLKSWPALYFDAHSFGLRLKSKANLDTIAIILRHEPGLKMVLEGHADLLEVPRNHQNKLNYLEQLGRQRVLAVAGYLRAQGVADSSIRTFSYAGRRPAAPNDTPKNRQINRRVEVKTAYVEGVEDNYGRLRIKFADRFKLIGIKSLPEKNRVQKLRPNEIRRKKSMKTQAVKPGIRAKNLR